MIQELVAVTTIRQGSGRNLVEKVRAGVFLDTAAVCANFGIRLAAVFKDCSDQYLKELEKLGVSLFE